MRSERPRPGFALPAVLAVTGVVTIIFLVAMTALYSLTSEAASARARVRFLQQAMSAEAALSYMVATEPFSARGVSVGATRSFFDGLELSADGRVDSSTGLEPAEVRLDGSPYSITESGLVIRLQDQAGMINLARLSGPQMERTLSLLGGDPRQAGILSAKYLDYVDVDDIVRAGGAERGEYTGVGETGPANRQLRRPTEWLSIKDFRSSFDAGKWLTLRSKVTYDDDGRSLNLNTASIEALRVLYGVDDRTASIALRTRILAPFTSLSQFSATLGVRVNEDDAAIYVFPDGRVWIDIRDQRSGWTYRARLTIQPQDLQRPIWIDQIDMLEAPRRQPADAKDVHEFPYTPR